ncbi:MAG: hypothetical protein LBF40_07690 [Deltaproteobacteria bacterium]|jgi:hypothetical protein|nr:hypothetical protein [Deltaproteobacteria bacterium]
MPNESGDYPDEGYVAHNGKQYGLSIGVEAEEENKLVRSLEANVPINYDISVISYWDEGGEAQITQVFLTKHP